jgi:NADH-quinone oxidoreductase subunit F/NADP-reducing hydrogenase subunit HndC
MKRKKLGSIEDLARLRQELALNAQSDKTTIRICTTTGCRALGATEVCDAFRTELEKQQLTEKVEIVETGCQGLCVRAPLMTIHKPNTDTIFYGKVTTDGIPDIISRTIKNGEIIPKFCYVESGKRIPKFSDMPFYKKQQRVVLKNCGEIDPRKIEQFIARDGFSGLERALKTMSPEEVIKEIKDSELRGRGGAGFPTGKKWEFVRNAPGDQRYIIGNGDEGDPGAFMDRTLLEGDPYTVLEGMLIAAYAIGATKGFFYVRAEYPVAVENIEIAVQQAKDMGLLGENILGTGLCFDMEIKMGAGAFVCGEETALIASIEGRRGMPRVRPPFPAISGLWGKPTNINNVETFANVPAILTNGSEWYRKIGTEKSKGTKIFALAGNVRNTGLVEVPMGTTLREIVFDIGGGIPGRKAFKAVQIGGPSGGCIPEQYLDLPIDYESVKEIGAIMGSGGLIVLDDTNSMVEIARYFMEFLQNESCGKCTPCRIGTARMLQILTRIKNGQGNKEDMEMLHELAEVTTDASLCGLGQTAANPVLTTIKYFQNEYDELIEGKKAVTETSQGLVHKCE